MKKYTAILLASMFVIGAVVIAYASHEYFSVPYVGTYGHYETMPQPAGGDLRHYITSHMPYKKEFALWPGKGKMYKGTEPHGPFITVYVNDIALKSIKKMNGLDNNSIVLKENYTSNKQLAAITVMYKVTGYNPEGGDWFWAKYSPDFKILGEGKIKGCLDCHSKAKNNDYVFTGKVTK